MKPAAILMLLSLVALALAQTSEPPRDDEKEPDFLEQLRAHAEQYLKDVDTEHAVAPTGPVGQRPGPVHRTEIVSWTDDIELTGPVNLDSIQSLKSLVRKVVIRDRNAIEYLFQVAAFQFSTPEDIEFMEIYDLSNTGFADGSVVKAHPSGETYILEGLSADFVEAASQWTRRESLMLDETTMVNRLIPHLIARLGPPTEYEWEIPQPNLPQDENERLAIQAIGAGVHEAVSNQYGQSPINLYFSRTDSSTVVQIWSFDPDSLRFNYLRSGDGIPRNDLLTVAVRDSFIKAFKSYVDVLVVRQARADTVVTAPHGRRRGR